MQFYCSLYTPFNALLSFTVMPYCTPWMGNARLVPGILISLTVTPLSPAFTRCKPYWASMGHVADFSKISAAIHNKYNSVMDTWGTWLERYTPWNESSTSWSHSYSPKGRRYMLFTSYLLIFHIYIHEDYWVKLENIVLAQKFILFFNR